MKNLLATAAVALTLSSTAYADEVVAPDPTDVSGPFQIGLLEWVNPETEQTEQFFYYRGAISQNSTEELERAFNMYPDVKKIALESQGGIATEGSDMGNLFSDYQIDTWVPKGRYCLSACANAFIGGSNYRISGILGFHAAWIPLTQEEIVDFTPDLFNAYYRNAQYGGVYDSYYWMVNGFSMQMPAVINGWTAPDKFLVFTSRDELMSYYVRDDEDPESQSVYDYMQFDDTRPQVIWSSAEMVPYLTNQIEELSTDGTPVELIDLIYSPFPEEEETSNEEGE